MKSLTVRAPAKLNLYLAVLHKRPDGFHSIHTVFEKIDLCDTLRLALCRDARITVTCDAKNIPSGEGNLAYKAAALVQEDLGIDKGVRITIKKMIPAARGLGGGSSDAAAVLLGLNRLWGLGLGKKQLCAYAKKLGSDVAFFLNDSAFALGTGRGDEIKPFAGIRKKFWHVLVVPRTEIPTKLAYRLRDARKKKAIEKLTKNNADVRILLRALKKNDLSRLGAALYNSFKEISNHICPDIAKAECALRACGIKAVSLSGKGPTVFGICSSRKEALAHKSKLKAKWNVFVARTL